MNYHAQYRRLRYELRCAMSLTPALYLPLARFKRTDIEGAMIVTPNTDLVLEGFPRSGNTFAYFALQMSQPRPLHLAHHFHAAAQVMAAVRWERPAMVIIRHPIDAVCSFLQREPMITPRQALRSWIRFYDALLGCQHGFMTATFEQVTSDFGQVMQRINERFGTRFDVFQHSKSNVAACFRAIEERNMKRFGGGTVIESGVARPSPERASRKQSIFKALEAPELESMREQAAEIYARYAIWAGSSCAVQLGVDG